MGMAHWASIPHGYGSLGQYTSWVWLTGPVYLMGMAHHGPVYLAVHDSLGQYTSWVWLTGPVYLMGKTHWASIPHGYNPLGQHTSWV